MSARMKKRPTKSKKNDLICIRHAGTVYEFPKKVADRYAVDEQTVTPESLFASINKQHSKPGALLKGIRVREGLTQISMAKRIKVTQSDISQMENGSRAIGRTIAKRIEKYFDVDYRSFLE